MLTAEAKGLGWIEVPDEDGRLQAVWRQQNMAGMPPTTYVNRALQLVALVGREPISPLTDSDLRWHISVRALDRVPTWEEMVEAAHALRPGVVFVIGVPPREWWVNIHENVLHLWEVQDTALVNMWREERRGDVPT